MAHQTKIFIILIMLVLLTIACDVQVTIILPPRLVPYYEWLTSFPTWDTSQPDLPTHMEQQGYQSTIAVYHSTKTLQLPGNIVLLPEAFEIKE